MKNAGNPYGIVNVLERARSGDPVTIGFIGGSITQGAAATDDSLCYPALVCKWWKDTFPGSDIRYVNAGIGATTSQFGAARAEEDLLEYDPDLVIVEFSVNDNDEPPHEKSEFFKETYEGLIRKICLHVNMNGSSPALLIVHSVRYDDGGNEEDIHSQIGAHYDIPCISMKELVYESIMSKSVGFGISDITQDMLHPNDLGHRIVAGHITGYLQSLRSLPRKTADMAFLKPVTCNCYENAVRYNNLNCSPVCNGFTADTTSVMQPVVMDDNTVVYGSEVRDVFKNGWTASEKGASITFRLTGTEIGVMYRKSVQKPAPVAYAVLDGDVKNRFRLDANFEEDWGDKAYMETLLYHGGVSGGTEHTLTVVIEEEGSASDFYLINVIVSGVGSGDEGKIS